MKIPSRCLIVNADDFGQSHGVNQGIIEAYEHGIVTSASLMVRGSAAREAASYACGHPRFSLGLHFDLGEWAYRDGNWVALYQLAAVNDADAVRTELRRQLDKFLDLMNDNPAHLDSHQHIHRSEPARAVMIEVASELGLVLRECSPHVRYDGRFYGQTGRGEPLPDMISQDRLIDIIRELSPGITELGCHPGFDDDLDSMYVSERKEEVRTLCAARIQDTITAEGIQLVSFGVLVTSHSQT